MYDHDGDYIYMYCIPGYFHVGLFSWIVETFFRRIFVLLFFCEAIMGGVVFTPTHRITPPISVYGRIIAAQSKVTMACRIYVESCERGYHTYHDIWDAAVGEELLCTREPNNVLDSYVVVVINDACLVEVLQQYQNHHFRSFIRKNKVCLKY